MNYNVTVSGTEYEGIEKVELPITDSNEKATFYAQSNMEDILCGNITKIESDLLQDTDSKGPYCLNRAYTFYSMKKLETVSLTKITALNSNMFDGCISLKNVNLPAVTGASGGNCFNGCTALEEITLPLLASTANSLFNNCKGLKKVDLPVVTQINASVFNNNSSLEAVILRKTTMVTLANINAFTGSAVASGTGYIYVPSALVDTYKSAVNWSTFATQFRAIEDYPDICG